MALVISILVLIAQLAGPSALRAYREWPRAGRQIAIYPVVAGPNEQRWEVPAWIYFPDDYSSNRQFPLLLYLHGSDQRGSDLAKLLNGGLPRLLASGEKLPMVVVSPQCRPDVSWECDPLLALLDYVQAQYSIDPERIYISGFSMGGYGTWHLAAAAADRFAAIAPVAGGGNANDAAQLTKLPIWAFHGANDETVPLKAGQEMVDAVNALGGQAKLTILENEGHGIDQKVFSKDFWNWLLDKRRRK